MKWFGFPFSRTSLAVLLKIDWGDEGRTVTRWTSFLGYCKNPDKCVRSEWWQQRDRHTAEFWICFKVNANRIRRWNRCGWDKDGVEDSSKSFSLNNSKNEFAIHWVVEVWKWTGVGELSGTHVRWLLLLMALAEFLSGHCPLKGTALPKLCLLHEGSLDPVQ